MMSETVVEGAGLLRARYGAAMEVAGPWPEAVDVMLRHRSVRAYSDRALPEGMLELLVAAGQSAATSSNLQLWSVVAVEDAGRRARLAVLAGNQAHVAEAPLLLMFLADLSRNAGIGAEAGREMEAMPFLETFLVAALDAALAAQNVAVAAEAMGLGTVYIGAMRNKPEAVAAELGLPPGVFGVFGLCVGYEDTSRPAAVKPRLPQEVVLHREQYRAADGAAIGVYDEALLGFQAREGMRPQSWRDLVVNRLGRVAAMGGRDRMVAALRSMGFGLQ